MWLFARLSQIPHLKLCPIWNVGVRTGKNLKAGVPKLWWQKINIYTTAQRLLWLIQKYVLLLQLDSVCTQSDAFSLYINEPPAESVQHSVPPAGTTTERGARWARSSRTARSSGTSLRRRGGRGARTRGSSRTTGTSWSSWPACEFYLFSNQSILFWNISI